MDILPGLNSRSFKRRQLFNGISTSNVISTGLKKRCLQLNKKIVNFLSTDLITYAKDNDDFNFSILQEQFQTLLYEIGINKFEFNRLSNIKLSSLKSIYERIANVQVTDSVSRETFALLNEYTTLILCFHLANSLIGKSLYLKSQSAYWENLNDSWFKKVIYSIQTSPLKLYDLSKEILIISKELSKDSPNQFSISVSEQEDNFLYHLYKKIRVEVNAIAMSSKTLLDRFVSKDPTFILLHLAGTGLIKRAKYFASYPLISVNRDIDGKLELINKEIEQNAEKIDQLTKEKFNISTIQSILGSPETSTNPEAQVLGEYIQKAIDYEAKNQYLSTDRPSFLSRYWLIITLLILYGPSTSVDAYNNRTAILDSIKRNIIDSAVGFFKNWVLMPVRNMLKTLRRDDDLSITSKDSLKSDLDSLERMIIEFISDENGGKVDVLKIRQMIEVGDLTMFMSKYEEEIRRPFKSAVKGSLIRSLLIQIQKTKVDGAIALNGIDKLLKSQQLVFGVVSISPSIFVLYKLWNYLTSSRPLVINGTELKIVCVKSLNTIEGFLIDYNQIPYVEGRLLIEISNFLAISNKIIPRQLQESWTKDLNKLTYSKYRLEDKLKLVSKLWNVYGPYFR